MVFCFSFFFLCVGAITPPLFLCVTLSHGTRMLFCSFFCGAAAWFVWGCGGCGWCVFVGVFFCRVFFTFCVFVLLCVCWVCVFLFCWLFILIVVVCGVVLVWCLFVYFGGCCCFCFFVVF